MTVTPRVVTALSYLFVGAFIAAYVFFALGLYNHNDHMYAVAPVVMQNYALYSAIAFDQTPLSLLLFYQIDKIVGDSNLYLTLRLLSVALNLAILTIGVTLCRRDSLNKPVITVIFASLYLWYEPTEAIGTEIGDYTLGLFFFAISLLIYRIIGDRIIGRVLVGVLVGLAISSRISYVYFALALGVIYLLSPASRHGILQVVTVYSIGVVIGLAPIIIYLIRDFDSFAFLTIHSHYLQNIYRGRWPAVGEPRLMFFTIALAVPTAVAGVIVYVWHHPTAAVQRWLHPFLALTRYEEKELIGLYLVAVFGAVVPGITFDKYWAPPGFIMILFACICGDRVLASARIDERRRRQFSLGAMCIVIIISAYRSYELVAEATTWTRDGVYAITAVARMRDKLAGVIAAIDRKQPGCHGELVSPVGVPAIGTGVAISPITASGPFIMRLDEVFVQEAPDYRRYSDITRYLSPTVLLLAGFYDDASYEPKSPFEKIISDYAAANQFSAITLGSYMYKRLVLYVPAGCRAAT
jgi:hypothetical protein